MKTSTTTIALVLIAFVFAGCASSENTTRSQQTINKLNAVGSHLNNILKQVNTTENSLGSLSNASGSELEDAYDDFRGNISTLSNMQEELNSRLQEMQNTSSAYLTAWRQESESYNNSNLQSKSEERRQELSESFNELMDNGSNVNRELESYISSLREVSSYLSNDLTPQGAEAATNSEEYGESANEVRDAIEEMQQSMAETRENMGGGSPVSEQSR